MIENIGLVGAGSVGSGLIATMYGNDPDHVFLVARGQRAERLRGGIEVNGARLQPTVCASADQGIHLDLLLVSVKSYSLDTVMEDIAGLIDDDTVLLPLLNGITATDRLRERFPRNRVMYGTVIRTDAHRIGRRAYFTTLGEMQIGYADNTVVAPEVAAVRERLASLGVNVRVYDDMRRMQWRKWMLNTGGSQVAAETGVSCGYFELVDEIRELIALCMDEIVALAAAEGVNVTSADRDEILEFLMGYPADKKMSMLQDLEAGRPIEIDDYAGTVVALGEKHGIPTPANRIMYLTITAREKINLIRRQGL